MEANLDGHLDDLFAAVLGIWLSRAVAVVGKTQVLRALNELADDDRLWLPDGSPAPAPPDATLPLPLPLVQSLVWIFSHPSASRETVRYALAADMIELAIRANAFVEESIPGFLGRTKH